MTYKGFRLRNGICRVTRDGRKIDPRRDLINHSPTGFEWGYGGSGPSQTALAILADFLISPDHVCDNETCAPRCCIESEVPLRLYQKFKWDVVATLPYGNWTITDKFLRAWLQLQPLEA